MIASGGGALLVYHQTLADSQLAAQLLFHRVTHVVYPMKVKELRKLIEADGWVLARQSGSHMQFKHPTKSGLVTLAGHKPSDDVATGTVMSVLKQAGLR